MSRRGADRWRVERFTGGVAAAHREELTGPDALARVRLVEVERPTLVLGSTQPRAVVDDDAASRAGVGVVRRHSGGGAVLLVPGEVLWFDVVVPAEDPLWESDVGRAAGWLGDTWGRALSRLGRRGAVHPGPMEASRWARLVCFGGITAGEVTLGGRKVVGISQRRTRHAVRFQAVALLHLDVDSIAALLALEPVQRGQLRRDLAARAAGVGVEHDALADAFISMLPA